MNEKKGKVVGAMFVDPEDELMLISSGGVVIRTAVADISQQGRDATGVSIMSLGDSDQVSAVARLFPVDEELVGTDDDAEGGADIGVDADAGAGAGDAVEGDGDAGDGDPDAGH